MGAHRFLGSVSAGLDQPAQYAHSNIRPGARGDKRSRNTIAHSCFAAAKRGNTTVADLAAVAQPHTRAAIADRNAGAGTDATRITDSAAGIDTRDIM